MQQIQEFSYLLQKLQSNSSSFIQNCVLKDIAATIQVRIISKREIMELLELLNTTHKMDLQINIFSIIAAYVLSNGTNNDVIVTYRPLYDRMQDMLATGLPLKTLAALNLVVAMLSVDEGEGKRLALHARKMLRVSGCLASMSQMFTSSMIYQDTWIVLCRSLAEACRGSELNQRYCSHLVPIAVERCQQVNTDACLLLQSLLENHYRNIKLFLERNGLAIFTRELLQCDIGMLLLDTVVRKSTEAISLLWKTDVIRDLRELLHLYGPHSQMGQWSTIILYRLNLKSEGLDLNSEEKGAEVDATDKANKNKSIPEDMTFLNDVSYGNEHDETKNLFQNVMKEIINSKNDFNFAKPFAVGSKTDNLKQTSHLHQIRKEPSANKSQTAPIRLQNLKLNSIDNEKTLRKFNNLKRELSFSLLLKQSNPIRKESSVNKSRTAHTRLQKSKLNSIENEKILWKFNNLKKEWESFSLLLNQSHPYNVENEGNNFSYEGFNTANNKSIYKNCTNELKTLDMDVNNQIDASALTDTLLDPNNFNPNFASTPKRKKGNRTSHSYRPSYKQENKNHTRIEKRERTPKLCNKTLPNKDMKNRSLSARLFSAINESCTTFVKRVKNVFKANNDTNKQQNDSKSRDEYEYENSTFCSYSFTNYMRRRDAILVNEFMMRERKDKSDFSTEMDTVESCKTCNNTIVLKKKLANDVYLKQTVRKLKFGINLFGCDFKKISKAMWPRERYMTPNVLYNLYRKLLKKY